MGFIFGLMCIVAGFTKDLFRLLGDRIQETHEMFGFFSKEGFKWYVHRFIDDGGPILWLFLLIVVGFAFTSAFSFIKLYYMYQPYF